jgi:hypothetical protein
MLPAPVSLHDPRSCSCRRGRPAPACVHDLEGFVRATLTASELEFGRDELEDLVAEGVALAFELAGRYDPHRNGYEQPGRLSGYLAAFLPKRLGDAWHRLHAEHRYVTDPATGKRSWHYDLPPASLDALIEESDRDAEQRRDPDRFLLGARRPHEFVPLPIPSRALD